MREILSLPVPFPPSLFEKILLQPLAPFPPCRRYSHLSRGLLPGTLPRTRSPSHWLVGTVRRKIGLDSLLSAFPLPTRRLALFFQRSYPTIWSHIMTQPPLWLTVFTQKCPPDLKALFSLPLVPLLVLRLRVPWFFFDTPSRIPELFQPSSHAFSCCRVH